MNHLAQAAAILSQYRTDDAIARHIAEQVRPHILAGNEPEIDRWYAIAAAIEGMAGATVQ